MTLRFFVIIGTLILMCFVTSLLVSYRYFFMLPTINENIKDYQNRELLSLEIALKREFVFLKTLNYDYSVWDESYDYMTSFNKDYIESNYVDDTFKSLKIDGVFIYDMNFKQVYAHTFDYIQEQPFDVPEFDLKTRLPNRTILPYEENTSERFGFLSTEHGPVMFASHAIQRTNKTGEPVGSIVFIKKVRESQFAKMAEMAQVKLSYTLINKNSATKRAVVLSDGIQNEEIATERQRTLLDINGNPILLMNIKHHHQRIPVLFDHYLIIILLMFFIVSLIGFYIVNRFFITPLINGASAINLMLLNNDLQPLHFKNQFLEMRVLINGFNSLIKEVKKQNEQLEKISKIDELTQIYNRRAFEEIYTTQWQEAHRQKTTLGLMLIDVDYFKFYNDFYGHQEGDSALQAVCRVLKETAQSNNGSAARYGGEEFIMLFNQLSVEQFEAISQQLLLNVKALNLPHKGSKVSNVLTVSVGCAFATVKAMDNEKVTAKLLIKNADVMLYEAKNTGRNRALIKSI
ncbi:sensor domain-containing diguanylate cyclase [Pseudoalteromonas sp. 10-33]|uniref:sensor domain-containing diguanylate cyclase n=1 Tax=Pseudoalteromonas sp. 10-33 TaxID=1761890 RepID=UPI0009EA5BA9|nr:diguanylate cyclase [Pseudoalteromonas sp. 10-33]